MLAGASELYVKKSYVLALPASKRRTARVGLGSPGRFAPFRAVARASSCLAPRLRRVWGGVACRGEWCGGG